MTWPVLTTVASPALSGLSADPPLFAMAAMPSAFGPWVMTVPRLSTCAIADSRLPSFSVSANRPEAQAPMVSTRPVSSFSTSASDTDQAQAPYAPNGVPT